MKTLVKNMETKTSIRSKALQLRKQLSERELAENSQSICKYLLDRAWYTSAKEILVYAAIQNEVVLDLFVEIAFKEGKQLYFPKVSGDSMEFYRMYALDELTEGAFHVPEPPETNPRWMPSDRTASEESTIILVPGVAFNGQGFRIGYGKGYYDRYLSRYPELFPIGIAHELQIFPAWDQDTYDIPMKRIITEKGEKYIEESGRIM